MQMIGEHDHGLDKKRRVPAHDPNGGTQCLNVIHQQSTPPLGQIYGEEITSAWKAISNVVWHRATGKLVIVFYRRRWDSQARPTLRGLISTLVGCRLLITKAFEASRLKSFSLSRKAKRSRRPHITLCVQAE